ncbi:MAG: hypothetical protein EOP85_01430 [Verrucomicrobiaceae bacterium]|nr:MAG: hypothetical protein EOP85_01430 [Verrucomicrobiaceae bacterium]
MRGCPAKTNNKELSVDGLLVMAEMGQEIDMSDPMATHQKVLDQQRQKLEDILRCFEGILTPGQMGQVQAALLEQREILKRFPRDMQVEEELAQPPPVDDPLPPREFVEDDGDAPDE